MRLVGAGWLECQAGGRGKGARSDEAVHAETSRSAQPWRKHVSAEGNGRPKTRTRAGSHGIYVWRRDGDRRPGLFQAGVVATAGNLLHDGVLTQGVREVGLRATQADRGTRASRRGVGRRGPDASP